MKYKFRRSIFLPIPSDDAPEDGGTQPTPEPGTKTSPQPPRVDASADDTTVLKLTLEKERQARRELERERKKYDGIDPEKYQKLLELERQAQEAEEARVRQELESKQKYEEILKLEKDKYAQEKTTYQQKIAELENRLAERDNAFANKEVSRAFTTAMASAGGYVEDAELLLASPKVRPYIKYDRLTDDVYPADPTTGDPITDGKGKKLSLAEWVETELKPKFERSFKPQNTNYGGGTPPTRANGRAQSGGPIDITKVSPAELMERARRKKA